MFSCCLDIPASDFLSVAMEFMLGAPAVAASKWDPYPRDFIALTTTTGLISGYYNNCSGLFSTLYILVFIKHL